MVFSVFNSTVCLNVKQQAYCKVSTVGYFVTLLQANTVIVYNGGVNYVAVKTLSLSWLLLLTAQFIHHFDIE